MTTYVRFEGALRISEDFAEDTNPLDVEQGVMDEFGYTGLVIESVTEWESDSND